MKCRVIILNPVANVVKIQTAMQSLMTVHSCVKNVSSNHDRSLEMKVTVIHKAFEDQPVIVAEVEAPEDTRYVDMEVDEQLEYAYRWTNNLAGSWSRTNVPNNGDENSNVTVLAPLEDGMGLRSTSIGDLMMIGNDIYEVSDCGFKQLIAQS
tara:strand:+ start:705 stop:1160 length:456 start_codon:yes stop_codon:yes gene_type:complete